MSAPSMYLFVFFGIFSALLLITGIYCMLVSFNLIRIIIGFEILVKAATLLIISAGYACGKSALAQVMVITLIVIEIVVMVVAGGVALWAFRHNDNIDPRELGNLKG